VETLTYHVFGDSHKYVFPNNDEFIHHEVTGPGGSLTAYNLLKPNSSTQSWKKLLAVIDEMKLDDWLIISAGEIDCRIHIHYQSCKQGIPLETAIWNTVKRYGAALLAIKILVNQKLIVLGIPPAGNEPTNMNYPPVCLLKTKLKIYKEFNFYMREFCRVQGIRYLDVFSIGADNNGYFKEDYTEKGETFPTHLNRSLIQPVLLEMLKAV
jgi:hypothetical protein